MSIRDLTADGLAKINEKLKKAGSDLLINPKLAKSINDILPKGVKIELDPTLKALSNDALTKAAEGKVLKVEVMPLLTHLRKALKDATVASPPEIEVGIQSSKLRTLITNVLNRHGFMLNISTVNDNYTKVVQQQLNGRTYKVTIHADAKEISRSVQASLMQVQSRYFGLQVSKDVLRNSIDQALMGKPFNIQIAVMHDQARRAVQNALNNARMVGKDDALAYQRLMTGELKAAQAELARLKAAHHSAADAAKAHASASINLGGAMGSNIKIAGELGSAMASMYSIHAAKEFLSQVIEIGGELEHQKIAMDTIFSDKGKTMELFGQIKGLARQSPFGVMELTSSVKRLSAYGVEYNEIYETAKRLADISAATSVDINRLILAFGKTKSRGFLDGLEAKQFAYANIPIYEMIRKKLEELEGQAVTTADVMARMKKREIGFDLVKDVLWDITDEGGKFYNMQEALAGSVKTSWKLVRDNIELMFGEIAESSVGSGLKSVAELLQSLTREWRTVAAVVGTAAIGLGVYRVATLGVNSAVQKGTIVTYNNIIAQKQKNAEELKAWGRITQLTKAELTRIATANKLTNADLRQAIAAGTLTDKHIAQLFWQKKVTAEQIRYLTSIGMLNPAMSKAILSNNRFTLSLQMIKGALVKATAAMKAFLLNPWTVGIAAISSLAYVWQHMGEQSDKAKELGENLSTKASEGARNLTDALKGLNGEFSKMSDLQLTGTVAKLEQAIKDYGVFADRILFYSQVDEKGMARTLEQRAEYLYQQAKILETAYAKFKDWKVGGMVSDAAEATNGNFWTAHWYEGLQSDIDDYVKDVRNAQKELTGYLREHEDEAKLVVKFAAQIDPEFADRTKDMGIEQAMTALMSDLDKLQKVYDSFPRTTNGRLKIGKHDFNEFADLYSQFANNWTNTDVTHSMAEVMREQDIFMASLKKGLLAKDKDFFKNLTEEKKVMLGIAFQETFRGMEGLDEQYIIPFVERWNNYFGTAFDPSFIEGQIQSQFQSLIPDLGEELAKKVRNGEKLEKAEEDKVKAVFDKAVSIVKNEWPGKAAEIQKIVDSNPVYANVLLAVNNRAGMDSWKKEVDDAFGNNYDITAKIKSEADTQSALKAIAELKKEAKAALDKFALTLNIKPNLENLSKLSTDGPLSAFERQQREEYNKSVDLLNDIAKGEKSLGINLDDWSKSKNKTSGSQKDTVAEQLKQRFKDIKDAWNEFQKWSKVEGRDAAAKRIGESGIFSTLSKDKIPQTVEQYRALVVELEKDLRNAGIKGHSQRESLLNELLKQLLDIDKSVVDEQMQKTKERLDSSIKSFTQKWDFYKQLYELTGDRETSAKLTFGDNVAWQTQGQMLESLLGQQLAEKGLDVPLTISDEEAKEKLKGTPLYDLLWKPTKDAKQKEEFELRINVAKAVADTASIADKIKAQEGLRDDALAKYRASKDFAQYGEAGAEAVAKPFNDKILELRSTMLQLLPVWEQIFGDREYASMKQLERGINAAKGIIDNAQIHYNNDGKADYFTSVVVNDDGTKQEIQGNISLLEKLKKAVISLNKEADKLNPFRRLANILKEIFSAPKDGKSDDDTETKLRKLGASLAEVSDMTGDLAGQLSELFDAAGESGLAQAMSDVQGVMSSVSNIGEGFAEGSIVGGIAAAAGEAIGWVTKAFQASARHKEALRAIMNDALAQQREYNLLLMQQNLEYKKAATILGEDTYAKARNAVAVMKDAYKDLQDELGGTRQQKNAQSQSDFLKRWFGIANPNAALKKAYAGLADIEIVTGHKKTGLFGWGKGKDVYSSILDVYPELIDANGKFNTSLAETIINSRKMGDEDKAAFQNMIDLAKQAEAAYEELNDYMANIFGELGSTMTDVLVSAFANGTDAAECFYDSVSDMLEALAKQMIYSVTLAPMIEQAQKQMMDIMQNDGLTDEQRFAQWAGVLDGMLNDALKQQGVANDLLKRYQDMAAEKGFDIFKPDGDKKSGMTAGIQSLTENTGDLLASYVNGIRGDVSVQTHDYWPKLLEVMPQISVIAQSQLDAQRQIAENTLRNALAAEMIVQYSRNIDERLRRAQSDKSTGFWMK